MTVLFRAGAEEESFRDGRTETTWEPAAWKDRDALQLWPASGRRQLVATSQQLYFSRASPVASRVRLRFFSRTRVFCPFSKPCLSGAAPRLHPCSPLRVPRRVSDNQAAMLSKRPQRVRALRTPFLLGQTPRSTHRRSEQTSRVPGN
jgi:hypothetical protein